MKISGIYKIQSVIKPDRCYIGSGVCIKSRWNRHLCDLRHNRHWSKKLQNHYNKYGESDLQFSILLIQVALSLAYCKVASTCKGQPSSILLYSIPATIGFS